MRVTGCVAIIVSFLVWGVGVFIIMAAFMAFVRMAGASELIEVVRHGLGSIFLILLGMIFCWGSGKGMHNAIEMAKNA